MVFRRKNREVYEPLTRPQRGFMYLPDFAIVARDKELMKTLLQYAGQGISQVLDGKAVAPMAALVEKIIFDTFLGEVDDETTGKNLLHLAVTIGVVVGEMEKQSGVARVGEAESHYRTVALMAGLKAGEQMPAEYRDAFDAAIYPSYWLCRIGPDAVEAIAREGLYA